MNCATCLDSRLVANDRARTPWPTVLAGAADKAARDVDFDAREGILRPLPCPSCQPAPQADQEGFAAGYIAGHREGLRAARAGGAWPGRPARTAPADADPADADLAARIGAGLAGLRHQDLRAIWQIVHALSQDEAPPCR